MSESDIYFKNVFYILPRLVGGLYQGKCLWTASLPFGQEWRQLAVYLGKLSSILALSFAIFKMQEQHWLIYEAFPALTSYNPRYMSSHYMKQICPQKAKLKPINKDEKEEMFILA